MIKSFFCYLFLLFFCSISLRAQQPCGFDKQHRELLRTDSSYARNVAQNNIAIQKYIDAHKGLKNAGLNTAGVIVIPVVVHVMHTGGAVGSIYNPSDAQIIAAINYLNQVYDGTYPGMTSASPGGAAGNMGIQFALAQRTPTCGATNGIDRVDASSLPGYVTYGVMHYATNGSTDRALKDFARWNPSNYYNIWVVDKFDGNDGYSGGQYLAGYAYLPGVDPNLDGTVILAKSMKAGSSSLPHELGHALNLQHVFYGSSNNTQCPPNADCTTDGDLICDTDPVAENADASGLVDWTCRTGTNNPCTGTPYTINTENNIMGYTNCFTLFTNDQKTRAAATMTLPSRASLIDAGNLALTPCGSPAINFSQPSDSHTEDSTGNVTGCRRYHDYTYQVVIGAAPTATATVTLAYSGTAVKGTDYDVTTNGNFAAPSNVLNFASGLTIPQTLTIRIYDDAEVESTETIVLDFAVNNGGGNAAKGIDAPTLVITLLDNDIAAVGNSSGTASIGVYTSTINSPSCFRSNKLKHHTQYLVTKAELAAAGITHAANLTSMALRVGTKNSTKPFSGFTVSIGQSSDTTLNFGFVSPAFTQVYSGNYSTVSGSNTIAFSSPFSWDGSSNIIVNVCFENASTDAANDVLEGSQPTPTNRYSAYSDYTSGATAGCDLVAGFVTNSRPNIAFGYSVIGTPVETIATASATKDLETGSNDYLYSNNNKLLMKFNALNMPLGCVTASLEEAGNVWTNYWGGQRSAKVFLVTPTTNGSTASYTASFYFDNAELAGKNPATLRMAKTSAASASAANLGNTVLVTPTVTTLGTSTTVFTVSYTGFSRFFLIDAAVILPIKLIDFTVQQNNDRDAVLHWTTSSEYNCREFEIEASRDGINFFLLGTVASKGNSAGNQQYEYLHVKPQPGVTYYRLHQIDMDGGYTYSKIISVHININSVDAFVYPVPALNKITINFGKVIMNAEVAIFSSDMKIVRRESIKGPLTTKEFNISNLSKGFYYIRYYDGATMELLSFIRN